MKLTKEDIKEIKHMKRAGIIITILIIIISFLFHIPLFLGYGVTVRIITIVLIDFGIVFISILLNHYGLEIHRFKTR
mgnify:CR=1 FL=1